MKIIKEKVKNTEIKELASGLFGEMIKFVVDIQKETIAFDAEMHADLEQLLLEKGSKQENLWGGNYFPKDEKIEFTSLINIRPRQNNKSMEIKDIKVKERIENIFEKLII